MAEVKRSRLQDDGETLLPLYACFLWLPSGSTLEGQITSHPGCPLFSEMLSTLCPTLWAHSGLKECSKAAQALSILPGAIMERRGLRVPSLHPSSMFLTVQRPEDKDRFLFHCSGCLWHNLDVILCSPIICVFVLSKTILTLGGKRDAQKRAEGENANLKYLNKCWKADLGLYLFSFAGAQQAQNFMTSKQEQTHPLILSTRPPLTSPYCSPIQRQ